MKKLLNCFRKNYGESQRFIRFSETDQSETDKIHAETAKNNIARSMDEDIAELENDLETKVNEGGKIDVILEVMSVADKMKHVLNEAKIDTYENFFIDPKSKDTKDFIAGLTRKYDVAYAKLENNKERYAAIVESNEKYAKYKVEYHAEVKPLYESVAYIITAGGTQVPEVPKEIEDMQDRNAMVESWKRIVENIGQMEKTQTALVANSDKLAMLEGVARKSGQEILIDKILELKEENKKRLAAVDDTLRKMKKDFNVFLAQIRTATDNTIKAASKKPKKRDLVKTMKEDKATLATYEPYVVDEAEKAADETRST